jgi:hypothetical protein
MAGSSQFTQSWRFRIFSPYDKAPQWKIRYSHVT